MSQISDSELELMRIIWSHGGRALFAAVMEDLEQQGKSWKVNTILTFLSRLTEKGFLSTRKIGRRNEYIALITEKEYAAEQTKTFLDKVYEGNARDLVAALVQQNCLNERDLEELKQFWNEGRDVR